MTAPPPPAHSDSEHDDSIHDPRSANRGIWGPLREYLVRSYVPTLMHALFHLMGVLLAFILASAWLARDSDLKDLRTRLGLLKALRTEAAVNAGRAEDFHMTDLPKKCPTAFFVDPAGRERVFKASLWQGLYNNGQAVILGTKLADELDRVYRELDSAPVKSIRYTADECRQYLLDRERDLHALTLNLFNETERTTTELGELDNRFWPRRFDSLIALTLVTWVTIIILPAAIVAGELAWRQRGARRGYVRWNAATYTKIVGMVLILTAIPGVFNYVSLGAMFSFFLTLIHIVGGAAAAYVGFWGSRVRKAAQVLGVGFTLLGGVELIGALLAGAPHLAGDARVAVFHLLVGISGLWVGFNQKSAYRSSEQRS